MKRSRPDTASVLDLVDQAIECCHNITTTARLLQTGGNSAGTELDAELAARAGSMIEGEATKLNRLLNAIPSSGRTKLGKRTGSR